MGKIKPFSFSYWRELGTRRNSKVNKAVATATTIGTTKERKLCNPHSAHHLSHKKLWLGTPRLDEWENR